MWNAEIFSQHNKSAGCTPDDEGETINLNDANEIAHDMDVLDLNDALDEVRMNNNTVSVGTYYYYSNYYIMLRAILMWRTI
jgi:hypothetical protein